MAKHMAIKKYPPSEDDDFDFTDEFDMPYPEAEAIQGVMHHAVGMLALQMKTTLDLTKLIVEKTTTARDEEAIFSLFKKASQVVAKSLAIEELFDA